MSYTEHQIDRNMDTHPMPMQSENKMATPDRETLIHAAMNRLSCIAESVSLATNAAVGAFQSVTRDQTPSEAPDGRESVGCELADHIHGVCNRLEQQIETLNDLSDRCEL
jgi:hypothetical protein